MIFHFKFLHVTKNSITESFFQDVGLMGPIFLYWNTSAQGLTMIASL